MIWVKYLFARASCGVGVGEGKAGIEFGDVGREGDIDGVDVKESGVELMYDDVEHVERRRSS